VGALAQQEPSWDPAYLHLVGHSLGAHVAAFASNHLLATTGRRVARITGNATVSRLSTSCRPSYSLQSDGQTTVYRYLHTSFVEGLDPALPGFATLWLSAKLDPSDADFVDVMHTNAGTYGKIEPSGHADFYVNGGEVQPFCTAPGRRK